MDPAQQLRNLRDFLLVYNRMTEICFQRCGSNFNYRSLTMDEERCADSCAGKLIRSNHRLMSTYVQLMPRMVQRRMEEMESKAAELAKAEEAAAAASAHVEPPTQTPVTLPSPTQVPPLIDQPVTSRDDVGPHDSVLNSAGLDTPSPSATEVRLSAAAPLTPTADTVNLTMLNEAGSGPSHTASFPQPQIPGSKIESEISAPAFTQSKAMSLSENVSVSTVAAPTMSEPSLSGQDVPQVPQVKPPSDQ